MKYRKISLLILIFTLCLSAGALAACNDKEESYDGVEVIFELEGGSYQNSTRAVKQYYRLAEGESTAIVAPNDFSGREITRQNYHIGNWCRTRTDNGDGTYSYSGAWNFQTDRISYGDDPLTLYCEWQKNVVYTYNICYKDEKGEVQVFRSYTVNEGDPFDDYRNYADARVGYTAERALNEETGKYEVCFYSDAENKVPWDKSFTHPGGDDSLAINVYVHYIEGDFAYVTTADELLAAANSGEGVWLCNDIDMADVTSEFYGFRNSAGVFDDVFYGNGHTISNIVLSYDDTLNGLVTVDELNTQNLLCVSLFGDLRNAVVDNVKFENLKVDIDTTNRRIAGIYVVPLAMKATNSKVSKVQMDGEFILTKVHSSTGEDEIHFITDKAVFLADDASEISATAEFTYTDNRGN